MLQVGRQEPRHESIRGVVLMSRDVLLRQTDANRFGEFQLSFEREPDLILYIELHGNDAIGVPLPDVNEPLVLKKHGVKMQGNHPE